LVALITSSCGNDWGVRAAGTDLGLRSGRCGPFLRAPTPLVIDLRGRHVPVPEELLHLADVLTGVEQEGRRCRPKRVRRVEAGASAAVYWKVIALLRGSVLTMLTVPRKAGLILPNGLV
jgi:hypothetical protein